MRSLRGTTSLWFYPFVQFLEDGLIPFYGESSLLEIVKDIATELVNVYNREPLETRAKLSELEIYGERILISVLHSVDNSFLRSLDPLSGHTQNSKAV